MKKDNHVFETVLRILILLAKNNSLDGPKIINELKRYNVIYSTEKLNAIFKRLGELLILAKDKRSRYRLTHLGLLLFFMEAYDKFLTDEISDKEAMQKRIRIAVRNHGCLFPLIFKNWRLLGKIYDDATLASLFRIILKNERTIFGQPLQSGGIYEIFKSLESIREVFTSKVQEELVIAKDVFREWLDSKNLRNLEPETVLDDRRMGYVVFGGKSIAVSPFGNIIHKINELEVFTMLDLTGRSSITLDKKLFLTHHLDAMRVNLESLVSFLFYTVLLSWLRVQVNVMPLADISRNAHHNRRLDIDRKRDSWSFFLSQSPEIIEWYRNCIDEIINFEKQNTCIMEDLGEFSLESDNKRKQLVLMFAKKLASHVSKLRT